MAIPVDVHQSRMAAKADHGILSVEMRKSFEDEAMYRVLGESTCWHKRRLERPPMVSIGAAIQRVVPVSEVNA
jgi:hypothetical protein